MARYSTSATSGAGSATLPIAALVGGTGCRPRIVEIGCSNASTTTAVSMSVRRITTAGTPGTALSEVPEHGTTEPKAATATAFNTYSSTGPTLSDELRRATIGPLAGIVWVFDDGLIIPATANHGIALIPTGTGQICDFWFVWDE